MEDKNKSKFFPYLLNTLSILYERRGKFEVLKNQNLL